MKTKERLSKLGDEAGMSQKTKELLAKSGNVLENKQVSLNFEAVSSQPSAFSEQAKPDKSRRVSEERDSALPAPSASIPFCLAVLSFSDAKGAL
jgi:hypothetical protein